jgi:prokaryotic ubiquitin-like protein Pup
MEGVMAEQKRKETRPTKPSEGKKIKEDIDKLLDEIDDILEENAEEFVKSYVQRGGE